MKAIFTFITLIFVFQFSAYTINAQTPDPVWATYVGGNGYDGAFATTVDAAGNIYIGGTTTSTDLALGANVHDNTLDATSHDAFIIKYSAAGQRLWATYFGGPGYDGIFSIVTDGTSVYISGITNSASDIAFGSGVYTTYGGAQDAFIARFNAANGAGIWGTYYGGAQLDEIYSMAIAPDGNIVAAGYTESDNSGNRMASPGAMKENISGTSDGILAKFHPNGNRTWATYIGGNASEWVQGLDISSSGTIYITGITESNSGISTPGAFQQNFGGISDVLLMAISADGTSRLWATYWGGRGLDNGNFVRIDPSGNLVITGSSTSPGLATPGTVQTQYGGNEDIIAAKFTPSGQRLWSTYLGLGGVAEYASGLDVDESGNILLSGITLLNAGNTGLSGNCVLQPAAAGNYEMLIAKISSHGARQWLTYYGTPGQEFPGQLHYIGGGQFVTVGFTYSSAFPVTPGADQTTINGGANASFLTVFSDGRAPELTVTPTTLMPTAQTTCVLGIPQVITGNAVTFTTNASYYNSQVFYQWQVADASAGPWTNLEGEVFKDLRPPAAQAEKYYRRIVLVNNGGCTQIAVDTSAFAVVSINSDIAPVANADGPQWYVCLGNTVTLNGGASGGTPGYTYQWYAGSSTPPSATTASYSPFIGATTTYTLRVTDAQGCVDIDQATIVPVTANAGPDASLCQGRGGVQIGTAPIARPDIIYSWSLAPIGDASASLSCTNCAQPIANPITATTYRLTVIVTEKDGSQCVSIDNVTVSPVNAPNNLTEFAGTDKTICKGTSVRLGGAGAGSNFTYAWTPGQYLTAIDVYNPNFNAGSLPVNCSMTYAVTATGSGCTFTDEVMVRMVDPSITNQNETVCGPIWSHQLPGTYNCPDAVYTWAVVSGTGSVLQTANNSASAYLHSPGGSTVFRRTTTVNGVSCSADITVSDACGAGCTADIGVLAAQGCPKVFGSATSFRLTVTGIDTSVYNINWSPASMVDNAAAATVTITSTTYNTITVTITNKFIPSISCTESIVVNDPAWTLPAFNPADRYACPATGVPIGEPVVAGYMYEWSPAAGLSSTTISNPVATLNNTSNYSYTVTEALTACRTSGQVLVNVTPVTANAGNDRTICNGATVTLGAAPAAGSNFTYSWQPSGAAYTNGTNATDAQPQVLFAAGEQTFTLTVTDPLSGCTAADDVTLRTVIQPGEYAGIPQTACPGSAVQLGTAPNAMATYQWTVADNTPATGLSCTSCANPILFAPDNTTTYRVRVNYPGCVLPIEDLVTITINEAPEFDLSDKNFCSPGPVFIGFGATGNPVAPANVSSYSWLPAVGLNNTTVANPEVNVNVITDYVVRVTYANGCVRTDSVRVTPDAIVNAGPDVSICPGQSAVIGSVAVAGATYAWSGGPIDGPFDVAQPTVNPSATTTYTVSVTSGSCTSSDEVVVTVNSPQHFTIEGNTAICQGGIATVGITGPPRVNTTWQWSPAMGVANPGNPNTTIAATDTMTYRLTQTNMMTGCTNFREIVIVVRPNNIMATASDIDLCAGGTASLPLSVTPAGSYQYLWQPAEGLSNAYVANPDVTINIARTYGVIITDNATNCQAYDSVRVNIRPMLECLPPVTLGGNVFHDANALKDAAVNITSADPLPQGLYVTMVNAITGMPVRTVPVAADGTYAFGVTAGGSYRLVLHQSPAGSASPSLPATWKHTGENLNTGPGSDNAADGMLLNITVAAAHVSNANFGIQQPPASDPKTYVIDQPVAGAVIPLNGTYLTTGAGTSSPDQLTGSDPEDGTLNGNATDRTLVIAALPDHGELWYNGVPVTAGQRIVNYDADLMSIRLTGSGYTSTTFQYAYVDAAGVEATPESYTIQWGASLPVTLTAFDAVKSGKTALLKWETTFEQNSDYFIVERSVDTGNWKELGTVKAAGNSNSKRSYAYTDIHPLQDNNYYRLRMVDKDGRSKLSRTQRLYFGDERSIHVRLVPNPAHDQTTIIFPRIAAGRITVKLLSNQGQVIHTYWLNNIGRSHTLDLQNIAKGIYVVLIEGEEMREYIKLILL